jgi:uncharacterized cupin superfamily protein
MPFTRSAAVVRAAALADADLDPTPLDPRQVLSGDPDVRTLPVHADATILVGIWQHGPGVTTDVEADEIFVVLAGRATIEFDGGDTIDCGPGDLVALPAGAATRWTVHETLRKVYVIRTTPT